VRWPAKRAEPFVFALNFLWLLSLFQDKESDKQTIVETDSNKARSLVPRDDKCERCYGSQAGF
jgi:hypothetical protein